jgi:chaperonin GroEL (HSP60 family)
VIKQISETGTKVVVAGGNIGELALHFIERYSMMALKVESKFQIRRLCQATGATPLVRLVCKNEHLLDSRSIRLTPPFSTHRARPFLRSWATATWSPWTRSAAPR